MFRKKEDYIVFGLAILLVIIVLGTAIVLFINLNQAEKQPDQTVTQRPTPILIEKDGILYNESDRVKVEDVAENREELSDSDIIAKDNLLKELFEREPSGYVYQSGDVNIAYLNPDDEFSIEILTTNIDKAKEEAVTWFRSKGISQNGICEIPISFYLNTDVAKQLENTDTIFSPLPPGC